MMSNLDKISLWLVLNDNSDYQHLDNKYRESDETAPLTIKRSCGLSLWYVISGSAVR